MCGGANAPLDHGNPKKHLKMNPWEVPKELPWEPSGGPWKPLMAWKGNSGTGWETLDLPGRETPDLIMTNKVLAAQD